MAFTIILQLRDCNIKLRYGGKLESFMVLVGVGLYWTIYVLYSCIELLKRFILTLSLLRSNKLLILFHIVVDC